SIGQSFEGREIWLATMTNTATGEAASKPALWVEANIHATEVTGCTAALYLINKLIGGFGTDESVTRVMDTRTFYVVPRLNPDGAELALADRPKFVRSSVRHYPFADEQDGFYGEDVDGDGRILSMRVRDDNGAWKAYPDDPRLLVARDPDEVGGVYYRLFPEGSVRNYDGVSIKAAPPLEGLDLNRNYPALWDTESVQKGAGPYPTSEPEVRAMVQAVVDRPNITGFITYHTYSSVHLRPYSTHNDDHFPTADLRTYQLIGEKATEITGYAAISIFHDFKYDPKTNIVGGSDDWMYDHLGVYAWTTEFWSPMKQAGITDYKYIEWFREHPVEDDLKLLKWNDEVLGGKGYIDWYRYEHPQLGEVELGGWHSMYCWRNPPPEFLEQEISSHADFAIFHLLISPKLELSSVELKHLSGSMFSLRVVVINSGWLPTNVTEKAMERKAVRPVEVELTLPDGATLVQGEQKTELGQLGGRDQKRNILFAGGDFTDDRAKGEWVIDAPKAGTLLIEARHQRAGTAVSKVELSVR
ncbi:MAG: M14 family metallopeptidase, partial [Actinomycetota bacterium]